jgi:hypothetical protein
MLQRSSWVRIPVRMTADHGLRDPASIHLTRKRIR